MKKMLLVLMGLVVLVGCGKTEEKAPVEAVEAVVVEATATPVVEATTTATPVVETTTK
jgi:uncharacterized protein YcfL